MHSQEGQWSTPVPVTDSISNNTNPAMVRMMHRDYLFYQKEINTNTSAIYMRNITEMTESSAMFQEEGVMFRNPQIIKFNDYPNEPDTLIYLVFESDLESNGIFNIYYSKYSQDGNFTQPQSIEIGYTSCNDLKIMGHRLIWERGENIETTYLQ